MNRRQLITGMGAGVLAPWTALGESVPKNPRRWFETEFEFEGHRVVYYRLSSGQAPWFVSEDGEEDVMVPFFDIREYGRSLEQHLREAILVAKEHAGGKDFVMHLIQYEGLPHLAIMSMEQKCNPKVEFTPAQDISRRVKRWRSGTLPADRNGLHRCDEFGLSGQEQSVQERINELQSAIKRNTHLVPEMNQFLINKGVLV